MMKRTAKIILFVCLLSMVSGLTTLADTSIMGTSGYFTVPITETPIKGTISIGSGYIFEPGSFYFSFNTAFIRDWEISAGKEILTSADREIGSTPFILGTKYRFYRKGSFQAAAGIQIELIGEEGGVDGTPITLYGVVSESAGKLGYLNTGLGYTFGIDAEYQINLSISLKMPIIGKKLFLVGEFTNYSARQGLDLPWDENRGIINGGFVLELLDFLKFKLIASDFLDDFLTVGLGAELRIKAF